MKGLFYLAHPDSNEYIVGWGNSAEEVLDNAIRSRSTHIDPDINNWECEEFVDGMWDNVLYFC